MKTLVRSARPSDLEYEEDEAFERAQWFADCEEYNLLEAQCHQHEAAYHEDMSEEEEAEHEARYIEMLDRLEDLSDLTEFNSPHFLVVQAGKKFDTHDLELLPGAE